MTAYRQLTKLLTPFPSRYIHDNPSGQGRGSYVTHSVVEQRLLDAVGPVSFELVEIVRGAPKGGVEPVVVGVVARMSAVIDGRPVTVEEAGDCENPTNWPHDGARMKDAMSDAYKRCAMRLGVGLHLWAQEDFYLGQKLREQDEAANPSDTPTRLPLEPLADGEEAF